MDILSIAKQAASTSVAGGQSTLTFSDICRAKERFAIGKNHESLALHLVAPLKGIIDDAASQGSKWNGIPLLKTSAVPINSVVINCSTSISPVAASKHLHASGFESVVGFNNLVITANGELAWPGFVRSFHQEMDTQASAWQEIFDSLSDDQSQKTLLDLVRFRYTANPEFMKGYRVRLNEQYFESFMDYSNEVFVDAGGFDGDTTQEFAALYADYKKILFFEPSVKNMKAAHQRLRNIDRIKYYPVGLSDTKGELKFNEDDGSASSIKDTGDCKISVDTLDSLVHEKVTFIKMDLEGYELKALHGAKGHLLRDRPKLAIAVYHDSSDFRTIFKFIQNLDLDYKVYLRHYTQGWSETVMYFKP